MKIAKIFSLGCDDWHCDHDDDWHYYKDYDHDDEDDGLNIEISLGS